MPSVHWIRQAGDSRAVRPSSSPLPSRDNDASTPSSLTAIQPYVCAVSPSIDLSELPGADLATTVQHALARIVSELHLISGWTSDCAQQLNAATLQTHHCVCEADSVATSSTSSVTPSDLERTRREVASELRSEIAQSAASVIVSATSASDAVSTSVAAQIAALERSVAQLQTTHQNELAALSRRTDSSGSALALQVADLQREARSARNDARKAHDQVAAALRVLRLEVREQQEQTQRRLKQFSYKLGSMNSSVKAPVYSVRSEPHAALPTGTGVILQTGASAMDAPDCFLYAKASLPPHRSESAVPDCSKSGLTPSPVMKRVLAYSSPRVATTDIDVDDALQVRPAVLQLPLGYDEDEKDEDEKTECEESGKLDGGFRPVVCPLELEPDLRESKASNQAHSDAPTKYCGHLNIRNSVTAATSPSHTSRFHSPRRRSHPITSANSKTRSTPVAVCVSGHVATQCTLNTHATVTPKPPASR